MTTVSFHYGVLSDGLEEQANEQGLTLGDKAKKWQDLIDAVNWIWMEKLINDRQHTAICEKFQGKMIKDLKPKGMLP